VSTPDAGSASPVDVTNEAPVEISGGGAAASPTPAATETTVIATPPAGTATAVATKTATAVATATPAPSAVAPQPGGGGLLGGGDDGFPTWAFVLLGMAAVLMLGGFGTAVTVRRRGK